MIEHAFHEHLARPIALKSGDLSGDGNATGRTISLAYGDYRGQFTPPRHRRCRRRQTQVPFRDHRPALPLAKVAELVLLIGWLDRARASVPPPPLVVRFRPCERRIWRDVVSAFAQQHP